MRLTERYLKVGIIVALVAGLGVGGYFCQKLYGNYDKLRRHALQSALELRSMDVEVRRQFDEIRSSWHELPIESVDEEIETVLVDAGFPPGLAGFVECVTRRPAAFHWTDMDANALELLRMLMQSTLSPEAHDGAIWVDAVGHPEAAIVFRSHDVAIVYEQHAAGLRSRSFGRRPPPPGFGFRETSGEPSR